MLAASAASAGSPPRPWGMRFRQPVDWRGGRFTPTPVGNAVAKWIPVAGVGRFTPTPVGNARPPRLRAGARAVHPHARGECGAIARAGCCWRGSPPRPWGMHLFRTFGLPLARFTPTPVGNANTSRCLPPFPHQMVSWFTPTPVGNAPRPASVPPAPSVHPHARGECDVISNIPVVIDGSPPRPWGMLADKYPLIAWPRFTPTPVGNAAAGRSCAQPSTVHPHARGECYTVSIDRFHVAGSPPRPWGMLTAPIRASIPPRFTPTPVGNAFLIPSSLATPAVHPHARGECASISGPATLSVGSPPRPWGMPQA